MKISEIISKFKGEKNMSEKNENFTNNKRKNEPISYRIYFNDKQLKNMKEMPVKEPNDKGEYVQQIDSFGNPLTETRCIIDIPDTGYFVDADNKKISLKGYNLVHRNQFFRSEHNNGFYFVIKSNERFRLDKIQPLKNDKGEIIKTPDGKVMFDFNHKDSRYVNGTQLHAIMESWKTKEKDKKPLNLNEYKDKAEKYNESHSQEKDDIHKGKEQEIN